MKPGVDLLRYRTLEGDGVYNMKGDAHLLRLHVCMCMYSIMEYSSQRQLL